MHQVVQYVFHGIDVFDKFLTRPVWQKISKDMCLCNNGWQGTLRPWSWCFLNPFERNYLLCTGGWLEDYMGFCAFIGKHIHVFQNVLFLIEIMFIFLRPPLPVFSLNCSKYFSSKEDLHFWTEPTKRDESFSLFLCRWCSGCYCHKHFVLLWSPTQLIWRDMEHTLTPSQ